MATKLVTIVKSTFGDIHLSEAWKSVLTGVIAIIIPAIAKILFQHHFPTGGETKDIAWMASDATIANIIRIFFSNSCGQFLKGEGVPTGAKE